MTDKDLLYIISCGETTTVQFKHLKNIHIVHENGNLTLAGYLYFAENPEYKCPTCMVKAVSIYSEIGRDRACFFGRS